MENKPLYALKATLLITCAFAYGVGVGRWEWPPFQALQSLKQIVSPPTPQLGVHNLSRRSLFEHTSGTAEVVMLGDSLTEHGNWSELFPGIRIFNRGIGQDTSAGLLSRLDEVIGRQSRLVLIMVGLNDLQEQVSPEEIEGNVKQIIERLSHHGVDVAVQSVLHVRDGLGTGLNEKIESLNNRLRSLSATTGTQFIDLNAVLDNQHSLSSRYSFDGVHLNGAGYQLWHKAIAPLVLWRDETRKSP
jgi:lysophospholipase L1-like esterase